MIKLLRIINLVVIVLIITCFNISPVSALQAGHSGTLNPEVNSGTTYSQILEVGLSENEPEADVYIEILSYREVDGKPEPLLDENNISIFSARSFIQPKNIVLHCKPGEKQRTQINIHIPDEAKSGGRYALLRFATAPLGKNSALGLTSAIILPMKFTVNGDGGLVHSGKISNITIGAVESGKPINIYTTFNNTGNHHFDIKGSIEIRDKTNNLIDFVFVNASSPIPESTKTILTTYIPKEDLPLGQYIIKERLTLEDGTSLDECESCFEVKKPYVPPAPPVYVDLKPGAASVLKTDDERILIEFPQGAILGETRVSLRIYESEQLPIVPTGYSLTTTCFRIDGLTGLLVKPAKVKVKYSAEDLETAGGDPSRFVFARWDESLSQWTMLKTNVDASNQSLSTKTNRFSLWSIMIKQSQFKDELKWLFLSLTIVIIASLIILTKIFKPKRKRH